MYQVRINHQEGMAFKVTAGVDQFVIDAKGKGLTPLDAFLAGLGSCVGVYVRKYCEGAHLALDNFQIDVSGELSPEAPFTFKLINVNIDFKGGLTDERRQKALLEFVKNCPAHNTLKGNPTVELKIC